jgi:hypothetical protein
MVSCTFSQSRVGPSGLGGAVFVSDATVILRNTSFSRCVAGSTGGAMAVVGYSRVDIADSRFSDNNATLGGSLAASSSISLQLTKSTFARDVASYRGGSLYFTGVLLLRIAGVSVTGSSAGSGGGGGIAIMSENSTLRAPTVEMVDSPVVGCTTVDAGSGGAVLWHSVQSARFAIAAPPRGVEGTAVSSGGGGMFVEGTPQDSGTLVVNANAVPITSTSSAAPWTSGSLGGEVWAQPFVSSNATFGAVIATSPRYLRAMCCTGGDGSCGGGASLSPCPNAVIPLATLTRTLAIEVLDAFGQHISTLSMGTCAVTTSVDVTGAISSIRGGRSHFAALDVRGVRGRAYPLNVACAFDGFALVLPPPALQVEVPLCNVGEEVAEDLVTCRKCGVGTFSVHGLLCVAPDEGFFTKDPRQQGEYAAHCDCSCLPLWFQLRLHMLMIIPWLCVCVASRTVSCQHVQRPRQWLCAAGQV